MCHGEAAGLGLRPCPGPVMAELPLKCFRATGQAPAPGLCDSFASSLAPSPTYSVSNHAALVFGHSP